MRVSVIAGLLATPLVTIASASRKEFTAQDLLSAPRPQAPIANEHGTQAISIVDQWDPEADK
jgi:hypothetical protein